MIFVSTSCVKTNKIKDSILQLAREGFTNIELSGGTNYYDGYINDLFELKEKFNLNYLIHNYFPPPKDHIVINLASLNDNVYEESVNHVQNSLNLASLLSIPKIGFHAGFLIDPFVKELGKPIAKRILFDREKSIKRFCKTIDNFNKTNKDVDIYIENNVFSLSNFNNYGENPLLFTHYDDLQELYKYADFPIILDVAHLKVSCNTLKIDFENNFNRLVNISDYLHLSDNDGREDSNLNINKNSNIVDLLKNVNLKNKIVTLEVYQEIDKIKSTYKIIEKLI